jgi:hypothetical protein
MMAESPTTLLHVVDAIVRSTPTSPGLEGRICIGTFDERSAHWWCAELGREPHTELFDRAPDFADAVLLLGSTEALRLLRGEPLYEVAEDIYFEGDRALMKHFLDHYLSHRSLVDVRSQTQKVE